MRHLACLAAILVVMVSCARKQKGPACTEEARAGLNVKVYAKDTGTQLFDSVTIKVQDGSFSEQLQANSNDKSFFGVFERPGSYSIEITHPNYFSQSQSAIQVTSDECHVLPVSLSYTLTHK